MKSFILLCVVGLQLGWSHGEPDGVGAFAYQDTDGNRYGGTYNLDDGRFNQNFAGFGPPFMQTFNNIDNFFPEYFSNLENLLRETFKTNLQNQRLAFTAAKKAYDLTSNQAGYIPNFPTRYDDFGGFGAFPGFAGMNQAFASAMAGPGFTQQIAAIDPNKFQDNVKVMNRFADTDGGYYGVSASSYATSSDVDGKVTSHRGAETVVNNNGKITKYKVAN
ncbi:unnamed protein product [Diatraea saccharalis]|uniref:Uncharacterized protein n=1 Tax=Diatraea saccharalis TaxID=40085 RepID=A0A9N9RHF1_9NEOP|nr:unnamed protein product [Diatraea saccharalis]